MREETLQRPIKNNIKESRVIIVPREVTLRLILLCFVLLSFFVSTSLSRTWYIKADGSGDAPTIQAGVDSSVVGDTVLVAEGTYVLESGIRLKGGVCILSENGPHNTKLIDVPSVEGSAAFWGSLANTFVARTEVIGFWIDGFTNGITLGGCENTYITNNIFTRNECGIFINIWGWVFIENNTFYGNSKYAIDASDSGQGLLIYNIIWGRAFELDYVVSHGNDFLYLVDLSGHHYLRLR